MNNLKQLTFAWILYSDDWDDKIINGSVEYKKWRGTNTIKAGKEAEKHYSGGIKPVTKDDWLDLLYIQKSCWWKLNYTPPYSPPL